MKQLTMTKVLTPLAALALAFGVQAATVSDGFETDTLTVVTNRTGWSFTYGTDGADDASAITAYDAATKPSSYSEAFASAGDNYLKLSTEDGTLFRNLSDETASRTVGTAGLFVDTDVQFTVTDSTDRPEVTAEDKFIIWLEADTTAHTTNLCVWAKQFTAGDGSTSVSNVYKLVDANGDALDITPGAWYRLTVKALSSVGTGFTFPAFEVYLNGAQLRAEGYIADASSVEAFKSTVGDETIVTGQKYLPAMADSMGTLSKVGFSGEGALDNIAITEDIPEFLPRQKMSVNWDTTVISAVTFHTGATTTTLTAPGDVNVDDNTAITFSTTDITFVSGNSNDYDFTDPENWTKSGDTALSLSGNTVTSAAGDIDGAFTIAVAANNNCVLALTAITDGENLADDITSVSYVITSGGVAGQSVSVDDPGDLENGVDINCLIGDVITFTVVPASGKTVTFDATSGGTFSDNAFTVASGAHAARVRITVASAKATIDGVGYTSFADAFNAAKAAGTAKTVVLADDATSVAATVENGNDITIDLAGNTITGADGSAVFTVAAGGTLTITNSTQDIGAVVTNGAASACISNAGTLNLQAGKFKGPISGGTINVSGGKYSDDIAEANIVPEGYELRENTSPLEANYPYELFPLIVVTFDANGGTGTMTAQSVNYNTATALTANEFTREGYDFAGWATASDGAVVYAEEANITATADTTLYAKWTIKTFTVTVTGGANATAEWTVNGSPAAEAPTTLAYGATYSVTYTANTDYKFTGTPTTDFSGTATAAIVIAAPDAVAKTYINSITLNKNTATVETNTTEQLTATYTATDDDSVTWTSSNGAVATVDQNGLVTAVAAGEAIITVRAVNGSGTASCTVTVTATEPTPVNPTIPENASTVEVAGDGKEDAATVAASVNVAKPAAASAVDNATYQGYFTKTATYDSESGKWTVTAEIAETVEQNAATTAAAIVDGTSVSGTVTVPAGLYYKVTTMTGLDGTGASSTTGLSSGAVNVSKPGTTQGFIKVQIGTAPFAN